MLEELFVDIAEGDCGARPMGRRGDNPNCSCWRPTWNTDDEVGENAGGDDVDEAGDEDGEGEDDGDTASESLDMMLTLEGRGGGEVSRDLERSRGASAIMESIVRRYREDLMSVSAGSR